MNDSHSSPLPGLIAPRSFSLLFELYSVGSLTFELYLVPVHVHIVFLDLTAPLSLYLSISITASTLQNFCATLNI